MKSSRHGWEEKVFLPLMVRALPIFAALTLLLSLPGQANAMLISAPPKTQVPAFLEGGLESRIGLLCHNDPVNKTDPTGLEVEIETRPLLVVGGFFALANHSWVKVVTDDNVKTTFSGTNKGNLGVEKNYKPDYGATNVSSRQVIPPPEGMTQKQWDQKVLKEGEKQMKQDGKRDYKADGGDGGKKSGNCHVVTSDIIDGAGGKIPKTYDPPGANPGLRIKDK